MDADIVYLQDKAASSARHVQRFAPIIPIVINALRSAGIRVERHYKNQVIINSMYTGRYHHPRRWPTRKPGRLAIYGRYNNKLILEITNEEEAKLFAATLSIT